MFSIQMHCKVVRDSEPNSWHRYYVLYPGVFNLQDYCDKYYLLWPYVNPEGLKEIEEANKNVQRHYKLEIWHEEIINCNETFSLNTSN